MTEPTFRELVDAAIEAHEPLDTAAFARLAESAVASDGAYWRSQVRLDHAVGDWRRAMPVVAKRPRRAGRAASVAAFAALKAWRGVKSAQTASALALGLSVAVVWWGREAAPPEPVMPVASIDPVSTVAPPVVAPKPRPEFNDSRALALVEPAPRGGFAEAQATTRRLAYAFEPVGEQVGSVVRLLIDAVPGSDVFSM